MRKEGRPIVIASVLLPGGGQTDLSTVLRGAGLARCSPASPARPGPEGQDPSEHRHQCPTVPIFRQTDAYTIEHTCRAAVRSDRRMFLA